MDAVDNAAPSEKGEAAGASSSDAAGASSSDAQPGSAIPVAAGGDAVNEEAPGGDGPDAPLLAAAAIGNTVCGDTLLRDFGRWRQTSISEVSPIVVRVLRQALKAV